MLFIHTIDKVLDGSKTQTRRIVKPNHHALNYWRTEIGDDLHIGMSGDGTNIGVVQSSGRDMWRVFSDYAVQPGRGKKAIAHIFLRSIRREDVRLISLEDAQAEGFTDEFEFMRVWLSMHNKPLYKAEYWGMKSILEHPPERYQAWVLTFALVDRSSHLQADENAIIEAVSYIPTQTTLETLESDLQP